MKNFLNILETAIRVIVWLAIGCAFVYILINVVGCKQEKERWTVEIRSLETHIEMPSEFKECTGYDSIQLVCGPDGNNLRANFCYPNQWNKYFRPNIYSEDRVLGELDTAEVRIILNSIKTK